MDILLTGPPGAGKGSQAEKLVSERSFQRLSTGDLFRKAVRDKTPLGLRVGECMARGALVPDDITVGLVKEALNGSGENMIFDGFPRTAPQSEALERFLQTKNRRISHVISLKVSEAVVLERLTGRRYAPASGKIYHLTFNPPQNPGKCDKTGEDLLIREDDLPQAVKLRLKYFYEQTRPLTDYYQSRGLLREINGERSPEEVFQDIVSVLF